jgi:hypothetical protein
MSLAPATQGLQPQASDMIPERLKLPAVAWQPEILVMAKQYCPEPCAHLGYRLVQPTAKFLFEKSELCADALAYGVSENCESALPSSATDVSKTQKVEGLRFAFAPSLAVFGRKPPKLNDAGFAALQLQAERSEALYQVAVKPLSFPAMLKADNKVVTEPNHYHVPPGMHLSPLVSPQIKHIVKIYVGQQWTDYSPNAKDNFEFIRVIDYERSWNNT